MPKNELKNHKVGDLIRNDSVYGEGETGVVLIVESRPHGEYDMLVKWADLRKPQWHCIDPRAKWYMKILAMGVSQ